MIEIYRRQIIWSYMEYLGQFIEMCTLVIYHLCIIYHLSIYNNHHHPSIIYYLSLYVSSICNIYLLSIQLFIIYLCIYHLSASL